MARAISTDPYMNFRFGLRLGPKMPWIGLTKMLITPTGIARNAGTIRLEKAFGEELIELMNAGKTDVNIGVFHIQEERPCDNPEFQIDLFGVNFSSARLSPIQFDAMGGREDQTTGVLLGELVASYDRCEMTVKKTKLKQPRHPHVDLSKDVCVTVHGHGQLHKSVTVSDKRPRRYDPPVM